MRPICLLTCLAAAITCMAVGHEHKFYVQESDTCSPRAEGVECTMSSERQGTVECITVTLHNKRHTPFQPQRAGLKLGIDTYMDSFPQWNGKYFPTLVVCEPAHSYGYLQSPSGRVKAFVCADPVASWSLDYNLGYQEPAPYWFYGHRIESLNLDLLAAPPLPPHHPTCAWQLLPGERRTWRILIADLASPDRLEEELHRLGGVPMLHLEQTSCAPGQTIEVVAYAHEPVLTIGNKPVNLVQRDGDRWVAAFSADRPGIYPIKLTDGHRSAHGTVNVRHPWRRTLELARKAVLRYPQKATSHVESWYGFHTAFLAARHFPDSVPDRQLSQRFDWLLGQLFDSATGQPYHYAWRIQNVSSTIGMLADRYEAYGNPADLDRAERLADWLISGSQTPDGAYMNGHTDYTSVIYPAKSLLELADAEYAAGRRSRGRCYEASARRAVDHLVLMDGNFNTEGEITYEDGMVSCSALQMGAMALRSPGKADRQRYTHAMLKLLQGHECLTQNRVPDGRRRGGTLRFWEAQYDVHMQPNMLSSPHGWSAWRAYATYYAYLLTGDERWLRDTFDAAASFASLLDFDTGELRWAFVVDPKVHARQISEPVPGLTADQPSYGCPHPDRYPHRDFVLGEQYVPMVADWQTIVSSDNDVHEVFKFIAEAVLTNAFVVERPDGSLGCYNCRAQRRGNVLTVVPDEPQITHLHLNVTSGFQVDFPGEITVFE